MIDRHGDDGAHSCRSCGLPWPCFELGTAIGALDLVLRVHVAALTHPDAGVAETIRTARALTAAASKPDESYRPAQSDPSAAPHGRMTNQEARAVDEQPPAPFAEALYPMPTLWKRLIAEHIPAPTGRRCQACTTAGTGSPGTPWPCRIRDVAEGARVRWTTPPATAPPGRPATKPLIKTAQSENTKSISSCAEPTRARGSVPAGPHRQPRRSRPAAMMLSVSS